MENNVFTVNWWKEALELNENTSDEEVIERVVKGFKLVPYKRGFGNAYTTEKGKATVSLYKRIYNWIKEKFPNSNVIVRFEKNYGTINLDIADKLQEKQYQNVDDAYEQIVKAAESYIEKAAQEFNVPIPDMRYSFVAGNMVVLSDDILSKLENIGIKDVENLNIPALVLNYDKDKYYLVYGKKQLSKGKYPKVLMATLNLGTNKKITLQESIDNNILNEFLKFAIKELELKQLPSKLTLSQDVKKARSSRTFGTFNPGDEAVWVYVGNRNMADILRTLAHELVHRKQAEENRLDIASGETGSEIENEANSKAGVLLRKFGEKNPMIYEHLSINEIGDIRNPFPWKYDFVDNDQNYFYSFNSPLNRYSVGITYNGGDSYEVFFNAENQMGQDTEEGVATRILSTVAEITLDFIDRVDPEEIIFRPIQTKKTDGKEDTRRFNVYGVYLRKNLPSNYNLIILGDTYRIIKK